MTSPTMWEANPVLARSAAPRLAASDTAAPQASPASIPHCRADAAAFRRAAVALVEAGEPSDPVVARGYQLAVLRLLEQARKYSGLEVLR